MIDILNKINYANIFLKAVGVFSRGVSKRDIISFNLNNILEDYRISKLYFMN